MVDVSIVIPLHNRALLVPFTLASLAEDLHPGVSLELIVVDDGSTDDGASLVRRLRPDAIVLSQPHSGASAARRLAISIARGRGILMLDSDDLIEAGHLLARLRCLDQHPSADGAYGPWDHFAGREEFSESQVIPRWEPYPIEPAVQSRSHLVRLLGGWYIPSHAMLWRTTALNRVGLNSSWSINQDVDLAFRILLSGAGIVGCQGPRALYREHDGSRVGAAWSGPGRLEDIYRLRHQFRDALRNAGVLDVDTRTALARNCFDWWSRTRRVRPQIASRFLQLARELDSGIQLRGRWPLRVASRVLGPELALSLRDRLRRPEAEASR